MARPKRAKIAVSPSPRKAVPPYLGPPTHEGHHVVWRFSAADSGGKWRWLAIDDKNLREFATRLPSFETSDYRDRRELWSIHPQTSLSKDAKDRLLEISRDDEERLISFHVGNRERVWCTEHNGIMCVLWWDPNHEVYPTAKR